MKKIYYLVALLFVAAVFHGYDLNLQAQTENSNGNPFALPMPTFEDPAQEQTPGQIPASPAATAPPANQSNEVSDKNAANANDNQPQALAELVLHAVNKEQREDIEGAVKFYDRALAIDPDCILALVRRSICYAKLGKHQEAVDGLNRATNPRMRPRTISDFAILAWLRATSPLPAYRDGALAVAYAQRALKESESAENYDILAAAYAEMGEFQKARDTLEAGIKFFGDSSRLPEMQERLLLYREKKKYREDWRPIADVARERSLDTPEEPRKKKKWWQW